MEKFHFDLNQLREGRWRSDDRDSRLYTTDELAERRMAKLMEQIKEKKFTDGD